MNPYLNEIEPAGPGNWGDFGLDPVMLPQTVSNDLNYFLGFLIGRKFGPNQLRTKSAGPKLVRYDRLLSYQIFLVFDYKIFFEKIPDRTNYEPNKLVRNRSGPGYRSDIIFFMIKMFFKSKMYVRKKSVPNQISGAYQIGTEKSPISDRTK